MTEPDDRLTPEAVRAHEAVMTLREPEPRAAFRARLERAFVTGKIASAPGLGADPAAAPRAPSVRARPAPARSAWLGGPWRWAMAAAAAIVATLAVQALNTGPAWRLVASPGDGIATVDGRPIPMNHIDELASALTPGARLRVPPGCEVEI